MNKNHSCGIDMIDGFSINLEAPHIEKVLLHLVNISISQSNYPRYWKVSRISPYYKNKGDRTDGEMYRPVSNLIYVGMLCEKVVAEQLLNHFVDNNLWHPNHHGFRPNHSTATALIQLYDKWITAVENGEFTAALLLDLSATFDLVDHQILLGKLRLYNFSDDTIAWFTSYLQDRVQYVLVESALSDPQPTGNIGVPQGSILGPLLYLIFDNDFPASRTETADNNRIDDNNRTVDNIPGENGDNNPEDTTVGESVLYADDDTDNISAPSIDILQRRVQREADLSTSWVRDNNLVCAPDKTKLMVMNPPGQINRENDQLLEIQVCGMTVSETTNEKLLGIGISSNMTWHNYLFGIQGNKDFPGLIKKLKQRIGMLHQVAKLLPKDRLGSITNGRFFSKLIYCLQVFGNCWTTGGIANMDEGNRRSTAFTKQHCRILQILENKVLRILTGRGYDTPISQLLEESGQLSVHQHVAYHTLLTIFKVMKTGEPGYLADRLGFSCDPISNRSK